MEQLIQNKGFSSILLMDNEKEFSNYSIPFSPILSPISLL